MLVVLNRRMIDPRPRSLVVVVGTGTEVGKTWVATEVLNVLAGAGVSVNARKLAQSHAPDEKRAKLDAAVLAGASGEPVTTVCPERLTYPMALAPPMAAEALGLAAPTMADLLDMTSFSPGCEVGVVETAGGLRSPQAIDGDALDACVALAPDHVVLVANAGLGTISSVRLCCMALGETLDAPVSVVVNRYDESDATMVANRRWLENVDGFRVFASPVEIGRLASWLREPSLARG